MDSTSFTFLFALPHLLFLSFFIHESQSCPTPNNFYCPDDAYNGSMPLDFPFTTSDPPHCGLCTLMCEDGVQTTIKCIGHQGKWYNVSHIFPSNHTIVVKYPDLDDQKNPDPCEQAYILSDDWVSFKILGESKTFVRCPNDTYPFWDDKRCNDLDDANIFYGPYDEDSLPKKPFPHNCINIQVPDRSLWAEDFYLQYNFSKQCQNCVEGKGLCYDYYGNFACDPNAYADTPSTSTKGDGKTLQIVLGTVLPGLAIISVLLIVYGQRRKGRSASSALPSRISFSHTRPDLEVGMGSMNGVTVFSYTELEEATNNFDPNRELGDGGFGVVYRGKLRDGREVAVKRLFEKNYKRVEQFKNEIRILTNLRHQNLVTLYGCTTRHSRELLLVYEYIPNGTVADHLHGDKSNSILLRWSTRMNIAIETATALSYLHFNDVIHRDVKTNNILLDGNFCVKVADFGLSRLFPADVTHISTAPQGTPGYLDPEYHDCYQLTNKSDVYSFGVVLIELISSLPAVDIGRHRHEFNLSDYAMNRIQCGAFNELVDPNLGFETDFKVRRMTTLVAEVAFRCLQQEKELRPTILEVLEALKGINNVDYGALEADEMSTKTTHIMKPPPSPTDNEIVEPFRNTRQQP